ncbi:Zn-dependent oxidoreductase [Pseudoclavibacter sp. RFBJ3]|uniref:zinc-binding alcohol dehydrogenase family protein n=1 Tax=unclassified Pseudoclavibacter TaxID=2615177 RepID=UPI000CE91986|nr:MULTISPECIES: zinc-binding alcohol dehydrogenase family protein [unclassified Pseudoclavibacter]PPF87248.1 Zn-dependent oxidoreductase [Pseudoclavibacter sp. RFBJ5]PPF89471.1 Zn-dependent oxidoreductase [Pseudoclavibacter sp. RFBJ3]PPG00724.1 Zn-dependent oxidoreductase [Pseudoclavibacter sp. RFBH5]PPG18833.1 Zn-dependent oxidoreductase [Pseudoclavibacter sp. RFBI4]
MRENTAAWIDAPYADLTIRDAPAPAPKPGPGQLLVAVRALAVNPLDAIIQSNGRLMYGWLQYPVILGEDVAGVVVEVGEGVGAFEVGDRVTAYAIGLEKGRDAVSESGFQAYVAVDANLAAALPDTMAFEEAVVLPLALSTAAAGLFETAQLGLDYSGLGSPETRDEVVVVWGGATAVGGNAIQLARAAGYRVVTTASARNHEQMKRLGAEAVFDYRDADVVDRIIEAVGGSVVAGVLAIAVGSAEPCLKIARATGATKIAMASPPVSFYEQPRRGGLSLTRIRLLLRLGTRSALLQVRSRARNIRASFIWGSAISTSPVGAAIWGSYLPEALATGRHRAYPDAHVVGDGLSALQGAIDTLRGGVSAQKLVVTLNDAASGDS